ncbi:MAG: rod shape-determining protein MreD [Nocardioidaceae bacterium]
MRVARVLLLALLLLAALTVQISVFPHLAVTGVVPDVVLVLVVVVALAEGPQFGAQFGLVAGLALDLAPPADHTLGRWALALVAVGYLAGLVRQDAGRSTVATVVTAAACAFIGTSLFAISGIVLGDPGVTVERVLGVLPLTVAYDVLLALVAARPVRAWLARVEPRQVRW